MPVDLRYCHFEAVKKVEAERGRASRVAVHDAYLDRVGRTRLRCESRGQSPAASARTTISFFM